MPAPPLDAAGLYRFLEALRENEPSFRYGVAEIARAGRLLDALVRSGRAPADPARLAAYVAPALCTSREEQMLFRARFTDHLRHGLPGAPNPADAAAAPTLRADAKALAEPTAADIAVERRLRWSDIALGAAFLALPMVLVLGLVFPSLLAPLRLVTPSPVADPIGIAPSQADLLRVTLAVVPWVCMAGAMAWRRAQQAALVRRYTLRRFDEREVRFGDPHDWHLRPLDVGRAMPALRRPVPAGGEVFDADASVAAALAGGGRAMPRMRAVLRPPEFILLAWIGGAADHAHRVARDLAAQLGRGGVPLAMYDVSGATERVRPRPDLSFGIAPLAAEPDGTVSLAEVLEAAPSAVVLLFGEGRGLAGGGDAPAGSAAALLAGREARAVLTPVPIHVWGPRERSLEEAGYAVVPADASGLVSLAEWLIDRGRADVLPPTLEILRRNRAVEAREFGPYPRLLGGAALRFLSRSPPPPAAVNEMIDQLKRYLGPKAFTWFAALAVYPSVVPDLTRELGRRLNAGPDGGPALFAEQRYFAIASLPWVARGAMPDWLRSALVGRLAPTVAEAARRALRELLIRPNEAGGVALRIVRRDDPAWRTVWSVLAQRARGALGATGDREDLHDQIFIEFMAGRHPLAVAAPLPLARLFSRLRARSLWFGALAVAACAGLTAAALQVPDAALPQSLLRIPIGALWGAAVISALMCLVLLWYAAGGRLRQWLADWRPRPQPRTSLNTDSRGLFTRNTPGAADPGQFETDVPARLDRLPWSGFHWRVVIALGITWVLDGLQVTLVGSLAAAINESPSLALSETQIGLAASAYLIGAVSGAIGFGYLADRLGRQKLFFVTLTVYMLASIATGFSWDFWSFALFRMITGAGIGGEYAAVNSAIQELIPARRRGTTDLAVNGTFWGGAALGSVMALAVLNPAVIDPEIGWRSAFVVGGALCCIVLFLRRFLPESPRWLMIKGRNAEAEEIVGSIERQVAAQHGGRLPPLEYGPVRFHRRGHTQLREVWGTMFGTHRQRSVLGLTLMSCQAFCYNALGFTYALVLTKFYGIPAASVGWYMLPFALGNLAGPLLLGPFFDTVGRRPMITGTYALAGLLMAVTGFAFAQGWLSAWQQTAAWTVIFFFGSAAASAAYLTVGESFPLEMRAMAIALFYAIGTAVGGVVGPALFGVLIQGGERGNIMWGYLIAAALMLVAAATEWRLGFAAEGRPLEEVSASLSALREGR